MHLIRSRYLRNLLMLYINKKGIINPFFLYMLCRNELRNRYLATSGTTTSLKSLVHVGKTHLPGSVSQNFDNDNLEIISKVTRFLS